MKDYESDTTRFIREFLQKNPQIVEKQIRARATWWDRPQDLQERKRLEESLVSMKPYEYY